MPRRLPDDDDEDDEDDLHAEVPIIYSSLGRCVHRRWCCRHVSVAATMAILLLAVGGAVEMTSASDVVRGHVTASSPPNSTWNQLRITEHPSDQFVSPDQGQGQGQPVTLNCKASSDAGTDSPPPVIDWYRGGGLPVITAADDASSHRMQLPNGQLLFMHIEVGRRGGPRGELSPWRRQGNHDDDVGDEEAEDIEGDEQTDLGEYYCTASDRQTGVSVVSRRATIDLAAIGAEFVEPPRDQNLANGDRATFRCRPPDGRPEPRVRWFKDGRPLTSSSSSGGGGRGRVSTVTVDDEHHQGTGNEDIGEPRQQLAKLSTLTIDDVSDDDVGTYWCVAGNFAGERISRPARLTVGDRPRIVTVDQEVLVLKGGDAVLPCRTVGKPAPTIVWTKPTGQMPPRRWRMTEDGSLRINRTEMSDDGSYLCRAENAVGWQEKEFALTVQSPPSFSSLPQDKTTGVGKKVELKCQAVGNPTPAVFWTKEASQMPLFSHHDHGRASVSEDGTLVISSPHVDDSGVYVCNAVSSTGTAYAKVTLHVTDDVIDGGVPPVILLGPHNETVSANSVLVLTCLTTGDPAPTVKWLYNGRPLMSLSYKDTRHVISDLGTLQITGVQPSDAGLYTCRAVSDSGATSWTSSVSVTEGPVASSAAVVASHRTPSSAAITHRQPRPPPARAPSRPTVTDITETSVSLSWSRPHDEDGVGSKRMTIDGFVVEYFSYDQPEGWVVASDSVLNESFTVRDLQPDTTYFFVVRSKNSRGPGYASLVTPSIRTKGVKSIKAGQSLSTDYIASMTDKLSGHVISLLQPQVISSTSLRLTWQVHRNQRYIEGVRVKYRAVADPLDSSRVAKSPRSRRGDVMTSLVPPGTTSFVLRSLHKYTWYEACVQPFNGAIDGQESNRVRARTEEDVPSEAPRNIIASATDNETLYLTWDQLPKSTWNGLLLGYKIHILSNVTGIKREIEVNTTSEAVFLHNVYYTSDLYSIQIAGFTRVGEGIRSEKITVGKLQKLVNGGEVVTSDDVVSEPWFLVTSIGVLSGTMWLAMVVFSLWLYKKRKQHKKWPRIEQRSDDSIKLNYLQQTSSHQNNRHQITPVNQSAAATTGGGAGGGRPSTARLIQSTTATYVNLQLSSDTSSHLSASVMPSVTTTTLVQREQPFNVDRELPSPTCHSRTRTADEVKCPLVTKSSSTRSGLSELSDDRQLYQQVGPTAAATEVTCATVSHIHPTLFFPPPPPATINPRSSVDSGSDSDSSQSARQANPRSRGGCARAKRSADLAAATAVAASRPHPRRARRRRAPSHCSYTADEPRGARSPRPARRTENSRIQIMKTTNEDGVVEFCI